MARQKGPDPATLAAHDVTLTEDPGGAYVLTCGQCGATWEVTPKGGRLAPLYWQCPAGCNVADQTPVKPAPTAAPAIPTDLDTLPAILTPAEAARPLAGLGDDRQGLGARGRSARRFQAGQRMADRSARPLGVYPGQVRTCPPLDGACQRG